MIKYVWPPAGTVLNPFFGLGRTVQSATNKASPVETSIANIVSMFRQIVEDVWQVDRCNGVYYHGLAC